MQIGNSNRVFGLDVMRAVAILLVVFSHMLWAFPNLPRSFQSLMDLMGVMGVELFFVLSGFLIGRILFRIFTSSDFKPKDLSYFLVRRWFRTLPNYYLILIINIIIVWYLGRPFADSLPLYFIFLQNLFTGMDIFFTESWSLPIEEFAYIIGPLLLYILFLFKLPISPKRLFLIITLAIISFFIGTKLIYYFEQGPTTADYWNINLKAVVLYRIDAIYYGVMAAYISSVAIGYWKRNRRILFIVGVTLFLFFQYIIGALELTTHNAPFLFNVCYLPVCSLLMACCLPYLSHFEKAPKWLVAPITFISLISYSMYLLHYSIVLQLMRFWIPMELDNPFYTLTFTIGYLSITIILAFLLYRLYEKPMMDIRDLPIMKKLF